MGWDKMSVTMYIYKEIDNPKHYSTADGASKMSVTAIHTEMLTAHTCRTLITKTTNALTVLTSVNEQLYLCTSRSTMLVWPLPAASITGVMPDCRKHSKRQDQEWIAQPTTGPAALYKIPACLTTHLGTSSGVQFILIDQKLDHFSMAFLSCQVEHGEPEVVSAVEQRLHLWYKVLDRANMASECSCVESILSILHEGNTHQLITWLIHYWSGHGQWSLT